MEFLSKEVPYILIAEECKQIRIDIVNLDRKAYNKINQFLNDK